MQIDNIYMPPGISEFQIEAWFKAIETQKAETLSGKFTVEVSWSGIVVRLELPIGVGGFEIGWSSLQFLDSTNLDKYVNYLTVSTVQKINE